LAFGILLFNERLASCFNIEVPHCNVLLILIIKKSIAKKLCVLFYTESMLEYLYKYNKEHEGFR